MQMRSRKQLQFHHLQKAWEQKKWASLWSLECSISCPDCGYTGQWGLASWNHTKHIQYTPDMWLLWIRRGYSAFNDNLNVLMTDVQLTDEGTTSVSHDPSESQLMEDMVEPQGLEWNQLKYERHTWRSSEQSLDLFTAFKPQKYYSGLSQPIHNHRYMVFLSYLQSATGLHNNC